MQTNHDFVVIRDEEDAWLLVTQDDLDALGFTPAFFWPGTKLAPTGEIAIMAGIEDEFFGLVWEAVNGRDMEVIFEEYPMDDAPCRDWPSYGTSPDYEARDRAIMLAVDRSESEDPDHE